MISSVSNFKMFRTFVRGFCSFQNFLKSMENANKEVVSEVLESGTVAFIGLNRPKAKNALGKTLISQFESAITSLHMDKNIRCLVIGSLAPNIFCAGADLKERKDIPESEVVDVVRKARNLFQSVAEIPFPTICAIDGPALGGGLELALACDLRYSVEDCSLGLVETRLAIIPGAGGTQRLPRLIGLAKAKELMFTAKTITGIEAVSIGIVNCAVKQNASGNAALLHSLGVAQTIACNGPLAVRLVKMAIDDGFGKPIKDALDIEDSCYAKVVPTKDRIEGLQAFKDKRKPRYEGK